MLPVLHACAGLAGLVLIAWLVSEARSAVKWRGIPVALGLQLLLAVAMLKLPGMPALLQMAGDAVKGLERATEAGATFVFGFLGGGDAPFILEDENQPAFVLAFQTLPLVILVAALTAILTHWRILPALVHGLSRLLERALGVGGAVGLGVGANLFLGMVESPLFIRAYLAALTRSELFTIMTAGMATLAGTVLAIYAGFLDDVLPQATGHLLTASLISAPAAVMFARLMVPETAALTGGGQLPPSPYQSAMDALTSGTRSGLELYLNIIAMLLVMVGLVKLVNLSLGLLPAGPAGPLTFEGIVGWLLAPIAWLSGIPASESVLAGQLLGKKVVLNEFLAYLDLAGLGADEISDRSRLILTYALCGFANFGSLGIMLAGLGTLVPERRGEIAQLGLKSILAGLLATCCTGAVIALITPGGG